MRVLLLLFMHGIVRITCFLCTYILVKNDERNERCLEAVNHVV